MLIKDNIDTADRMMTTAGSLALVGSKPPKDSFVAQRLRAAGAVILGKTNLSEWANIRSSHSTSGWSGRGGLTKNPYALDRNPCGSSSGTGAGISANPGRGRYWHGNRRLDRLSVVVERTGRDQADGGTGQPQRASFRFRTARMAPVPMCRTVRDAAILLGALTGVDPDDAATAASAGKSQTDYAQYLRSQWSEGRAHRRGAKIFRLQRCRRCADGAVARRDEEAGSDAGRSRRHRDSGQVRRQRTACLPVRTEGRPQRLSRAAGPGRAGAHAARHHRVQRAQPRRKKCPTSGRTCSSKSQAKGPLTEKEYLDALAKNHQLARTEGIDALMDKHQLDAIVAPTGGPAWLTDLVNGDPFAGGSSNAAAVAGYPNINVTAGFISGLPVGISFFGRAWSEPTLIKLAYSFEQATKARQAPRFLPSIGGGRGGE